MKKGHKYECTFKHFGETGIATNVCIDLTDDKLNSGNGVNVHGNDYGLKTIEAAEYKDLDVWSCHNSYHPANLSLTDTELLELNDEDLCKNEKHAFGVYGSSTFT